MLLVKQPYSIIAIKWLFQHFWDEDFISWDRDDTIDSAQILPGGD